MLQLIVFGLITTFFIAALFLAWYLFHQAKNKERLVLLDKGMNADEIFKLQQRRKVKFIFPWLKLGIVITSMSLAFLIIGLMVYWLEHDLELFKGFVITFILGFCLGISFIINHQIGKKDNIKSDQD